MNIRVISKLFISYLSVGITFESERKGLLLFSIFAVMGKLLLGDPCLRRDDRVREMVWGVTQHTGCRIRDAGYTQPSLSYVTVAGRSASDLFCYFTFKGRLSIYY